MVALPATEFQPGPVATPTSTSSESDWDGNLGTTHAVAIVFLSLSALIIIGSITCYCYLRQRSQPSAADSDNVPHPVPRICPWDDRLLRESVLEKTMPISSYGTIGKEASPIHTLTPQETSFYHQSLTPIPESSSGPRTSGVGPAPRLGNALFIYKQDSLDLHKCHSSETTMQNLSPTTSSSDGAQSCAVCLKTFQDTDIVRHLPCKHVFHQPCIDPWLLKISGSCPMCSGSPRDDLSSCLLPTLSLVTECPSNQSPMLGMATFSRTDFTYLNRPQLAATTTTRPSPPLSVYSVESILQHGRKPH